jgi:rod shape-determining protein MreB
LLQDTQRLLIGQEQAEAIKLEIGAAFPGIVDDLETQVAGRDLRTGLLRRTSVDADAVRAALQGPLTTILDGLESVLERTPPELAADIADRGVMLVGGGALLRGFDRLIRQRTGLAVTIAEEPLITVARGAGLALENFDGLSSKRRRKLRSSWRR